MSTIRRRYQYNIVSCPLAFKNTTMISKCVCQLGALVGHDHARTALAGKAIFILTNSYFGCGHGNWLYCQKPNVIIVRDNSEIRRLTIALEKILATIDVFYIHSVPKKHMTTFSIITLTISVRLQ